MTLFSASATQIAKTVDEFIAQPAALNSAPTLLNQGEMASNSQAKTVDSGGMIVEHDRSTDILYASKDPIPAAANVEVEEGIYVRVDPHNEIVGLQVLDYSARVDSELIALGPRDAALKLLEKYGPIAQARYGSRMPASFVGMR